MGSFRSPWPRRNGASLCWVPLVSLGGLSACHPLHKPPGPEPGNLIWLSPYFVSKAPCHATPLYIKFPWKCLRGVYFFFFLWKRGPHIHFYYLKVRICFLASSPQDQERGVWCHHGKPETTGMNTVWPPSMACLGSWHPVRLWFSSSSLTPKGSWHGGCSTSGEFSTVLPREMRKLPCDLPLSSSTALWSFRRSRASN